MDTFKTRKALIYIHGKGGAASDAKKFEPLFPGYDVIGFDYISETPWRASYEFTEYFNKLAKTYCDIVVIASSIGAYLLMNTGLDKKMIRRAFFISPIVDMEKLIRQKMASARITEEKLSERKVIALTETDSISMDYLVWAMDHPTRWNVPTYVLYGEKDRLQTIEMMQKFVEDTEAKLTVMPGGDHRFYTDEQVEFMENWIRQILEADRL